LSCSIDGRTLRAALLALVLAGEDERRFWEMHDSADDYLDWSKGRAGQVARPEASTTAIALRIPMPLLERSRRRRTSAMCRIGR
jgi:hypothetical protein